MGESICGNEMILLWSWMCIRFKWHGVKIRGLNVGMGMNCQNG